MANVRYIPVYKNGKIIGYYPYYGPNDPDIGFSNTPGTKPYQESYLRTYNLPGRDAFTDDDDRPPGSPPGGPPGGGSSGGGGGGGGGGFFITTRAGQKLSAASYDAVVAGYRHWAMVYGYGLSDVQARENVLNDVSVDEFRERLDVVDWATQNKTALDQLSAEAKKRGLKGNLDTLKGRLDFAYRLAPDEFYKLWESALTRTSAVTAGLNIGGGEGDLDVNRKSIMNLMKRLPGRQLEDTTEQFKVAASIFQLRATGRLSGIDLSDAEIFDYGFGRANVETERKIKQLVATEEGLRVSLGTTATSTSRSGGYAGAAEG